MGMKVNFSNEEANSTPREIPPSGEYHCKIVEIKDRDVQPGSLHAGKPFWNIRFVIQNGKYADNSIFANVMLFTGKDGTLGSLSQLLKALGYDIQPGDFELPENEEIIGKDINVKGNKLPAGFSQKAKKELPERFNVTGYKTANTAVKAGTSNLLP